MKEPEHEVGAPLRVLVEVQTFPPKTRTVSVAVQTPPPKTYTVLVDVEKLPSQPYEVLVECPATSATNREQSRTSRSGKEPKNGNDKR